MRIAPTRAATRRRAVGYLRAPVGGGGAQSGTGGRRLERSAAAALLLLPLALVALRCGLSPRLPFLLPGGPAWIAAPAPVSARLEQWGERDAPVVEFAHSFRVEDPRRPVALRLRAFGAARVFVNGEELTAARSDGSRWREATRIDPTAWLRPGANELRVEVANKRGPALLQLGAEGLPDALATGPDWTVSAAGGSAALAVLADDTRRNPAALAVETPARAVAHEAGALLLLFAAGALAFALAQRRAPQASARLFAAGAPVAASAAWLWLFAAKLARIPSAVGFDARHHLQYLQVLRDEGRLPDAAEGWSTYHPPLFYALSALLGRLGDGDAWLKLLPMLSGLALVWLAWLLARGLLPRPRHAAGLAALFAAVLPVNLYSAAYFSNESLHAALASAALLATVTALRREDVQARRAALAGLLFGLAALAKFTVLVGLPVALAFLAWKWLWVDRAAPARAAGAAALLVLAFGAVAGWFYLRTWLRHGTPLLGNWALPGADQVWWQQPGFHTFAYYSRFGEALVHPYLAGFHSFWDGLYCTFWGDGYIAGRGDPAQRHGFWNYGFMSAGYWVALPATALLVAGGAALLGHALGGGPPRLRLALGFLACATWAVFVAFLSLTLDLPFFAQAKAAYLLMLTGPLALAFSAGFCGLDAWLAARGAAWARALLYGWLAAFAGTLFLGFAA